MYFLQQFWSFVLFSFCIWFYVFAPGSHCFAIDILNRSAICPVHFWSIWTAPLRFSTCRIWAGSKVTAAKLDPKKSHLKKKNQSSTFPTGFSNAFFPHFFTCSFCFTFFPKCIFNTHFFTFFSKRIFSTCFHIFVKNVWKNVKTCVLKMRFQEHMKKCVLKMWKTCE